MTKSSQPFSRRHLLIASASTAVASPSIVRAETAAIRWRCATSWLKNMPGPGVSARRISERVKAMSDGALVIDVFGAGEIVPAFQVLDAVSLGSVEMGHTASLFWGGKMPAAPLFTTAPFGLDPLGHVAWLAGGGQALWDELYAPFKVRAFAAGNTGPSAAGWFKRELKDVGDLKGLRIRATGLGGEVYGALGATALAIPPGDTYAALERGVIDAVELLAPVNDLPLGLGRIAPVCYFPGFNKPNGASEALINAAAWSTLTPRLQAIVEAACRVEHELALAEAHTANAQAIRQIAQQNVKLARLPADILAAAQRASDGVLDKVAATSDLARRIVTSQRAALSSGSQWRALAG